MSKENRRVCVLWTAACSFCEKVLCSHMLQPENENPGIGRNAGTHERAVGAEKDVEKKEPWQRLSWQWLTAVCSRNGGPFWRDLLEGQHGPALALYHLTKCCWGKEWISEKHGQMLNSSIALMGTSLLRMHKIYRSSSFFMQLGRNAAASSCNLGETLLWGLRHADVSRVTPSHRQQVTQYSKQRSQATLPRTWLQTASPGWRHFCGSRLGWQVLLTRTDRVRFTSPHGNLWVKKSHGERTLGRKSSWGFTRRLQYRGGLRFKAYCWCQGT